MSIDKIKLDEILYSEYLLVANSMEEPDYDIHVDDPNSNCIRVMTVEEFNWKVLHDLHFAAIFNLLKTRIR